MMHSRIKVKPRLLHVIAIAATTMLASPLVLAQVWSTNTARQAINSGAPLVAKRIDSADTANYCTVASMPGTHFTWVDTSSSGLDYPYAWALWATSCPTAVARMRGAEVKYAERVEPISGAIPVNPAQRSLAPQEVMKALDGGAMVLMIPVNTAAQAQQVVKRAYYPPMGQRSVGPGQFDEIYPAGVTGGSYRNSYNDNLVVIAIVSTVEGASNAKAIAATPGIHALFLDSMNLESSAGYPQGSPDYNKLADLIRVSALASRKHLCTANRSVTPHTLTCATPSVSFFVSSATSPTGNLGGLAGADATCQRLGAAINQGARTWRAYLSVERDSNGAQVNARDRIGSGPWYNANLQLIANDLASLHSRTGDANLFVDERGQRINGQWPGSPAPVEHDILTGSNADGTVRPGATCSDWTSAATDVTAQVGHSDGLGPNQNSTPPLSSWNSAHTAMNCSNTAPRGGAGRIYCFAQ